MRKTRDLARVSLHRVEKDTFLKLFVNKNYIFCLLAYLLCKGHTSTRITNTSYVHYSVLYISVLHKGDFFCILGNAFQVDEGKFDITVYFKKYVQSCTKK